MNFDMLGKYIEFNCLVMISHIQVKRFNKTVKIFEKFL